MKIIYISILILILIIYFLNTKKNEHLQTSNEAVQNIAKIYADAGGTASFNNIKANSINTPGVILSTGTNEGPPITMINTKKANAGQQNWTIYNMTGPYEDSLQFWKYDAKTGSGQAALKIMDNGDVKIHGSLSVDDSLYVKKVYKNENRARYIVLGNNLPSSVPHRDYWTLIEIEVFDQSGNNVAKNKTGRTTVGSLQTGAIANILDGVANQSDDGNYYHGGVGKNEIEIDLGQEYNISQINIFNRYFNTNVLGGTSADYSNRLDNTSIQLLDGNKNVKRVIFTGNWYTTYSKEFIL